MKTKSTIKLSIALLLAAALAGLPALLPAQGTDNPAEKKETKSRKPPAVTPFNGKLKTVDKTAKTISVGERTFQITSETRIVKAVGKEDKPAVLEDGVVGENVSGAYKKAEDGTLHATKVTFGAKTTEKEMKKDKKANANVVP